MRKAFDAQLKLDVPNLDHIEFDPASRHELEPILMALKHIYESPKTLQAILKLIAKDVAGDKNVQRGCPGLDYWEILVLAAARLGCDLDYDALADLATNHKKLRLILGRGDWDDQKRYPYNTIRDNLVKIRPETYQAISDLIVAEGHRLKPQAIEKVRGDSVVVQTNIHYPTDANLILDGVRKVLSLSAHLGQLFSDTTWQNWRTLFRPAKKLYRQIQKIAATQKLSKDEKTAKFKPPYQKLIAEANDLTQKALKFKKNLKLKQLPDKVAKRRAKKLKADLNYFISATQYVAWLAERRVLHGETIKHDEKLHSLFEPHTQLINRGKFPFPIEFGHPVFFVEDQIGFIVDYQVMKNSLTDEKVSVPLLKDLQKRHQNKIKVVSLDKGSWTPENFKELQESFEVVCLPKKGRLTEEAKLRERTPAFRQARRWHPGVESAIHALVSGNGLAVCRDKGETGYDRYVALGVLGRNLHTLGKILFHQARDDRKRLRRAA
jgi:hypothetical protein